MLIQSIIPLIVLIGGLALMVKLANVAITNLEPPSRDKKE